MLFFSVRWCHSPLVSWRSSGGVTPLHRKQQPVTSHGTILTTSRWRRSGCPRTHLAGKVFLWISPFRSRISSRSQRRLARGCCRLVCVELCVCLTLHGVSDVAGGAQGPVSTLLGQLGQKHTAQLIGGVVTLRDRMRINRDQIETFEDKTSQMRS